MFKTKKPLLILAALFFITVNVSGQKIDFDNYTTILSSGTLPPEFSKSSTEKYYENAKQIGKGDNKQIRKDKREFYLEAVFSIDNLLRSGRILYNDTMGAYINRVMAHILKHESPKSTPPRVYVLKTNYSNAFSTDQGLIFITTGLLCRLQNEAQLAFVLCHELMHFRKEHSIDVFLKEKHLSRDDIKKDAGYDSEPLFLAQAAYSKEKEVEADLLGFELYMKTGYSTNEALAAFDVLNYSYLPFDSVPFNTSYFDTENLVWPSYKFLEKVTQPYADENTNDSFHTHPNIFKRKSEIVKRNTSESKDGGSRFIISENGFFLTKKIACFEYCRQAYLKNAYADAIYAAYCLLQTNPGNKYLEKIIAKSLVAVTVHGYYAKKKSLRINPVKAEGEIQQVHYFLKNLEIKEHAVLAANYVINLRKKHAADAEINSLYATSLKLVQKTYLEEIEEYSNNPLPDSLKIKYQGFLPFNDTVNRKSGAEQAYADSIKQAIGEKKVVMDHVFSGMLSDEGFRDEFNHIKDSVIPFKKAELDDILSNASSTHDQEIKKSNKIKKPEKVIFYNPIQFSIDERNENKVSLQAGEKELEKFISSIKLAADASGIPYEVISGNTIDSSGVKNLNKIALTNEWIEELFGSSNLKTPGTDFKSGDSLTKLFGTRYLCLVSNVHITLKKKPFETASYVVASVFLPVISWPLTFDYLFLKQQHSLYMMMLIDLKTGNTLASAMNVMKSKNRKDIGASTIYDFIQLIKNNQYKN